jgi:DNA-binding PadR family transcriptional regulator
MHRAERIRCCRIAVQVFGITQNGDEELTALRKELQRMREELRASRGQPVYHGAEADVRKVASPAEYSGLLF